LSEKVNRLEIHCHFIRSYCHFIRTSTLPTSPAATEAAPHGAILAAQQLDQAVLHRIASDKRPGPVRHVIHALPELLPNLQREVETLEPRLGALMADLQRVSLNPKMTAGAQAFSLVDEKLGREWNSLSLRLDELHTKILAQMR
jgi:hypothetical protein